MQLNPSEISELIRAKIQNLATTTEVRTQGTVVSVTDGIVRVHGLSDAMQGEMLEFPKNTFGLALNLERDSVGAVVLGAYEHITEGDTVKCTGRILEVPVGEELIGRVVNSLGQPIDGKGPIATKETSPIEKIAPGVIWRKSVSQPVQTGLKAIDSMVPIGRGQRELIIGDRQTGKTAVAIDTIINQKGKDLICIYCAIGQKASSIVNVVRKLEEHGAMDFTSVVAASASESAAMQYIAPYSGCTMGEYFRDRGKDALIIYDDLTKQAWAYRQVSLLLRRPPGREAYPGDVFYLHSRLLERAARVNEEYVERETKGSVKGKTGSLTALPIIETQAGDVTAFVPTNVISITDGQIFLETDLFNAGIRPAINAGISVSRVGGAAQTKVIKKLGGGVRLALAQYRELAAFAQFASDLDEATRKQLERGRMVTELMKQPQYSPLSVAEMALTLFAVNRGYLDDVEVSKALAFDSALRTHVKQNHQTLMDKIQSTKDLDAEGEKELAAAIEKFKKNEGYTMVKEAAAKTSRNEADAQAAAGSTKGKVQADDEAAAKPTKEKVEADGEAKSAKSKKSAVQADDEAAAKPTKEKVEADGETKSAKSKKST
jgi:F-type H+/Na+-transporting ATPase subunit alpha